MLAEKLKNDNEGKIVNEVDSRRMVQVYIQFNRIGEIDTMNERYHAEATIEARWLETSAFDEYDPVKCWNPKLSIENANNLTLNEVTYKCHRLSEEGITNVTEVRKVKGAFWERLELKDFPIDIQELSITVVSKLKPREINIISDRNRISYINVDAERTFIDQQKWHLFKMVKVSGVASYDMGSASSLRNLDPNTNLVGNLFDGQKIVATCYVHRRPDYYFFNLFSLMFIITTMTLPIFSVDCKSTGVRLGSTFTVLLNCISNKHIVGSRLPTVSYLTSLDRYSIVTIFFVCSVCIYHSIIGSFWEKPKATEIDQWMLVFFACVYFLINLWIVLWFVWSYWKIRIMHKAEVVFLDNLKKKLDEKPSLRFEQSRARSFLNL